MKFKFSKNRTNIYTVTSQLIRLLNLKVTNTTINECLETHPDYPTLFSISSCLRDWKINNDAYQIDLEEYSAQELMFPFIAYLPEEGGRYILVREIKNSFVYFSDEVHKLGRMSEADLLRRWEGVVLHASASVNSGEVNYSTNRVREILLYSLPVGSCLLALGIGYLLLNNNLPDLGLIALALIKTIGLSISVLLLIYSVNSNNPLVKSICGLGTKSDCSSILSSAGAKLFDWLSWSEVGFFYFFGTFLCLFFVPASISYLFLLNLLSLPYTVYSVLYQYRKGDWCLLCCGVQIVLWIEFVAFFTSKSLVLDKLDSNSIIALILCFAFPIILWGWIKPMALKASQLELLQGEHTRFKFDNDLFQKLLYDQQYFHEDSDVRPIVLGDLKSETIITLVTNPLCGPCAKAHKLLGDWLEKEYDFQLRVIFSNSNSEEDVRSVISRHFHMLNLNEDNRMVINALNDWYMNPNYSIWSNKYPVELTRDTDSIMMSQKEWCQRANIMFTPTILFNGYKLPEPYTLKDLKYFIS